MTGQRFTDPVGIERGIVLEVLCGDHAEEWSRAELERELQRASVARVCTGVGLGHGREDKPERGQAMRSTASVDPRSGLRFVTRRQNGNDSSSLAFAVGMGVSSLAHIERAECEANLATAEAIAGALGVSMQKLVPSRPPRPRRDRPARPGVNPAVAVTMRRLHEERGLSQQGLAQEAYLTVERGGVTQRMDTMQAIADGLEVSLQELIQAIGRTREAEA